MRRLVVCVGYIGREAFEFDCEGDRLQVESMLATRDDDADLAQMAAKASAAAALLVVPRTLEK